MLKSKYKFRPEDRRHTNGMLHGFALYARRYATTQAAPSQAVQEIGKLIEADQQAGPRQAFAPLSTLNSQPSTS